MYCTCIWRGGEDLASGIGMHRARDDDTERNGRVELHREEGEHVVI
jgi:hypothetical protein